MNQVEREQIIKLVEDGLARNEQNAIDNRAVFRVEMIQVIESTIQKYVNGKIDKIQITLDELKPLIKERNDRLTFWVVMKHYIMDLKWVVVLLGTLWAAKAFGKDIIKFIIS